MMKNQPFPPIDGKSHLEDDMQQNTPQNQPPQVMYIRDETAAKPRRGLWVFLVSVLVIVAVLTALWMSGVSHSLTSIQQGVHANGRSLSGQNAALAAIRQQLNDIGAGLNRLAETVHQDFIQVMQLMRH